MKPSADPEIDRILHEPEGDTPRDHLELLSVLSNRITPAGIVCPPPTLGTYALLSCIRSPFLTLPRGEIRREDAAAALFILSTPKQAAELLRQRAICEERYSRAADGGADGVSIRETLMQERKFRKEWKRQLRRFEHLAGADSQVLRRTADELALYLDPGIGFSMLPEPDESDPQAFNLETVARIAAGLAEVMPGTATDRLLWEIPMVETGMLLVQAARKHGMQGVSRDEKTRRLWQRFEELQDPGRKKSGAPALCSGKAKKARRHCSRIHSAADLHLPSARGGKKQKTGIQVPASGQTTVSKQSSMRQETVLRETSARGTLRGIIGRKESAGNRGDRMAGSWRGTVDLAPAAPASSGPLQTLTNSVIHIENILKHQLPDSVV